MQVGSKSGYLGARHPDTATDGTARPIRSRPPRPWHSRTVTVRTFIAVILIVGSEVGCGKGAATPQRDPSGSEDTTRNAASDRDVRKSTAPPAETTASAKNGAQVFLTLCAQCHGPDAKGYKADRAPSLVNPTFLESASDDYLRQSIERGRPGTSMAAYAKAVGGPLTPEAVTQVVAWLRAHGPPAKELPPVAQGNAQSGATLYASHCQKCHGDRQTRGDYIMLANPRFLEAASDAFIHHAIAYGRPGTPMEAFRSKLGAQEIADIVAHVRSFAQTVEIGHLPAPTGKEPLVINPKGKPPKWNVRADRFVGVDEVKAALDAKRKLVIIDARPESDWMTSHITGAVSIPHYQLERLSEIPREAWVVAYCACPHHLSGIVVDELKKRGHRHAFVLDEGILEWQRRKYPITAAPGAPMPPAPPRAVE